MRYGTVTIVLQTPAAPHGARGVFDLAIDMSAGLGLIPAMAYEFLFLHQIHLRGQISQILDTFGLPSNWGDNAAYLEGPGD